MTSRKAAGRGPSSAAIKAIGAAAWLGLGAMPAQAQCIMCRESLASGGSRELITGFMFSTLLLTAVPVILLSVFVWVVRRSIKRQAELEAAIGPPPKG